MIDPLAYVRGAESDEGSGASVTLTVTRDNTKYTRTNIVLQIAKKTKMCARFTTAGERGASDIKRDIRGFALFVEDIDCAAGGAAPEAFRTVLFTSRLPLSVSSCRGLEGLRELEIRSCDRAL